MNQNFTEQLANANNKDSLIQLMNELDEEKRRIKTIMGKFSNEDAVNGGLTGKERQTKLREMERNNHPILLVFLSSFNRVAAVA